MKTFLQNLVKTIFLLIAICFLQPAFAQAPQKMSYQAVIRNASNTLVANTAVGIKISILQTTATGTAVFVETQTPTTNANGLATIEIGGGTPLSGSFATINWANGPYFIKTETDPTGGTNYTIAGTSELLSVPFALYAANSSSGNLPAGNAAGDMLMWNGTQWQPSNFKYYYADKDGDTFGNHFSLVFSPYQPSGFVTNDCDDDDENISGISYATNLWFPDADADGFADASGITKESCFKPAGYTDILGDCNDTNALVYPNAPEICDGLDNDCDGVIDEKITVYADNDQDTFGDPNSSIQTCVPIPTGYVTNNTDCDGTSNLVYPGANEICDGIDNDCDGQIDEKTTVYLDNDHDNFGDINNSIQTCYPIPSGYVIDGSDCNDNEYYANPGLQGEICDGIDNNCDGVIDDDPAIIFPDNDGDGFGDTNYPMQWNCADPIPPGMIGKVGDCDDNNPSIYKGAIEICDGQDNDCNGLIDDNVTELTTFYADTDNDNFGDINSTTTAIGCTPPNGFVINNNDCDDTNPNINPSATELCNGIDDNCNGQIDDGETPDGTTYYYDMDEDGFGDALNIQTTTLCYPVLGWSAEATDCDDQNPTINPEAPEICDGIDNNCNGIADEGIPTTTWYFDEDGDGYGSNNQLPVESCLQPQNFAALAGDCDDQNPSVNPNAPEICDGLDNDCNGNIDGGFPTTAWYFDGDGDGYGYGNDIHPVVNACFQPQNYVAISGDCDDNNASVHPDAIEICGNDIDENCDSILGSFIIYYLDADGDGYGVSSSPITACTIPAGYSIYEGDCDDSNSSIHPNATEICDGIDNNCDGQIDEGFPTSTWYFDGDGDGYGGYNQPTINSCFQPQNYVAIDGDCNDTNAQINPGAIEICGNGIDENCDTILAPPINYYLDADGDGYGNPSVAVSGCSAPAGYVANNTDCNDSNPSIHPGAIEICGNAIDENCNGQVDEAGCQ